MGGWHRGKFYFHGITALGFQSHFPVVKKKKCSWRFSRAKQSQCPASFPCWRWFQSSVANLACVSPLQSISPLNVGSIGKNARKQEQRSPINQESSTKAEDLKLQTLGDYVFSDVPVLAVDTPILADRSLLPGVTHRQVAPLCHPNFTGHLSIFPI